ncbi:MAG: ABC transporter substrate-binding protein [Phycisphaeraceae bacterium]
MENRFGFKDFVNVVLLLAILATMWIAIKQFDRQWDDIKSIKSEVRALATAQNQLKNRIEDLQKSGVTAGPATAGAGGAASDAPTHALDDIRQARSAPDFAEGDVLVDAFGTNVKSVTALTYKDLYGRTIQNYVLESLATQHDDTLEWLPLIAESWDINDNSKAWDEYMTARRAELTAQIERDPTVLDSTRLMIRREQEKAGKPIPDALALTEQAREAWIDKQIREDPQRPPAMTIVFRLRRDVNFSDGQPLTARDVEFTWTLLNNPLLDAPETRNFYDNVESYKALDDFTMEFKFREPHYLALSMVAAFGILPKHFYSKFSIDDINDRPGLLMGSGAYRLEDPVNWGPGKLVKLVRNENYWGPKPGIVALIWLEIKEDVPRFTAFKNGQIDLFSATPEQYIELRSDPDIAAKYQAWEYKAVPSGYNFVAWNLERNGKPTHFADKRVRQAMTYLIDRQRIAEQIFRGFAQPTSGPFDEESPQSDATLKPRLYDKAKALALLAEVGWTPGSDGVLRNKAGQSFAFTLTYPSGSQDYEQTMLMIKDSLNDAGILMTQDPQDWSIFIERVDGRAFDACALGWGGGAIEGDIRQMFHSSQIAGGANNFTSYRNPQLDKLIDQARRTINEDQRMKHWQACHRILYEDQPYTFMLRRKSLVFIDKRVHNVRKVLTGLSGRTTWYVPGELQKRRP